MFPKPRVYVSTTAEAHRIHYHSPGHLPVTGTRHVEADDMSPSARTFFIDKPISDSLRIVTGGLRPTPADYLFILAGIQPIKLCRQKAVLSSARRAQEPKHLLYKRLLFPLGRQLW